MSDNGCSITQEQAIELQLAQRLGLEAVEELFTAAKKRELSQASDQHQIDQARRYLRKLETIVAEKHDLRRQFDANVIRHDLPFTAETIDEMPRDQSII